jgi:hypothetical protein
MQTSADIVASLDGNHMVACVLLLVNLRKTTKSHSCQEFNDQQVAI